MEEGPPPDISDVHGWKNRLAGTALASPQLCTARDNEACHIIDDLAAWNELLLHVRLELKEEFPGKLRLGTVAYLGREVVAKHRWELANLLVYCLLKQHRCVASLDIYSFECFRSHKKWMAYAIRASSLLKCLRVVWLPQCVASAISFNSGLEELKCDYAESGDGAIEPVCSLVATSVSLKRLSLRRCSMSARVAGILWDSLATNSTLRELAIHDSCIFPATADYSIAFAQYVGNNRQLSNLRITSSFDDHVKLKAVLELLMTNETILNVDFEQYPIDHETACTIEKLLTKNSTLRSFNLHSCDWYGTNYVSPRRHYDTDDFGTVTERIHPWVSILKKNESLREMRFNLRAFSPAECAFFFAELKKNFKLKTMTIEDFELYYSCRARRIYTSSCTTQSITAIEDSPDRILAECKKLRTIRLSIYCPNEPTWCITAVRALQWSGHITTVDLSIVGDFLAVEVTNLIARYIETTSVLKELRLSMLKSNEQCVPAYRMTILEALHRNTGVQNLCVTLGKATKEETVVLATAVRSSKSVQECEIRIRSGANKAFVSHLSPGLQRNFTLVSIHVFEYDKMPTRDYFDVTDVARRNYGFVTRAAHFVAGNYNRQGVEALEFVAWTPALVNRVGQLTSVDELEAAQKVRDSLSSIQGADDFMRATAVVKKRAACQKREEGLLQLSDLDEHSWLRVRRYLRIVDVVHLAS